MDAIIPFLKEQEVAFEQNDITAMSMALENVCKQLNILDSAQGVRLTIARRIIALARRGERNPTKLRDCLLGDANGATKR